MADNIKELRERLAFFEESPYVEGYCAIKKQLDEWAKEISEKPISLKATKDEDMKAFEKAHKFLSSIDELYDKLEFLRNKMTPEQLEKAVQKSKKHSKTSTIPF